MQVIHEERRDSQCPPLPLEVWGGIIAQIDSVYHPRTWLNLRRVSHLLKAATEHVFATKYLPQSWIEFKPFTQNILITLLNPSSPDLSNIRIQLSFEGLSGDGDRATFASKQGFDSLKDMQMPSSGRRDRTAAYDIFMRKWHELARSYTQPSTFADVCYLKHCIVFHRDANDTELPGVEFDLERVTVSVLWKPMLSIFYGEIEYGKWASKVIQQHAARIREDLTQHAMSVRDASDEDNRKWLQQQLCDTWWKEKGEEGHKTSVIREMRFKRILERTEHREIELPNVPDDSQFATACLTKFVDKVKYALERDRGVDEDTSNDIEEEGRGCFYDGMDMKYDGIGVIVDGGSELN